MAMTTASETAPRTDEAVANAQIHFVIASIAVVGLLLTLGATFGFGLRHGLGVLVGASLATLNLWSLKRIGAGIFSEAGRKRRLWGVAGALKFMALAGLMVALLALHVVQPIAFVIGYGALPIGITLGSLLGPRVAEESVH
jgi:hypothetical protein